MSSVLGIDIGGSHITAALVDLDKGAVVAASRKRKGVDAQADATQIIADWCEVINQACDSNLASKHIGISMPGPFDYENGISLIEEQDKFKTLYKVNVKNRLAERLKVPSSSIRFMNDAACFLQGEVFGGAAKGVSRVIGLTLGTGLGSAFSINGIAEDGALWKSKFKDGIAEDYLASRWFVKRYEELSGITTGGVREMLQGAPPQVAQVFEEFSKNLGEFLVPYVSKFGAETVVFGGNISRASSYFLPALHQFFKQRDVHVALQEAVLHEDAALIGAASCWNETVTKVIV